MPLETPQFISKVPEPKPQLEILKDLAGEQALKDARQKQIDDAADQAAIQAAIKSHTDADGVPDLNGALQALYTRQPRAALKFQPVLTKMRADAAELANKEDTHHTNVATRLAQAAGGEVTPENYALVRQGLIGIDPDTAQVLPPDYSPQAQTALDRFRTAGTSVKDANDHAAALRTELLSGNRSRGAAGIMGQSTSAEDWDNNLHQVAALGDYEDYAKYKAMGYSPDNVKAAQQATMTPKDVATFENEAAGRKLQQTQQDQTKAFQDAELKIRQQEANTATAREKREAQAAGAGQPGQPPKGTLGEEALNQAADRYFETGVLPPLGMGSAAANNRVAIMNRAGERHAGGNLSINSAAFAANKATLTQLTKQLNAVEAFENTGLKNLKLFTDAAANIPDTGIPWLNTPVRALSQNVVGDANMAAVNAARQVALTEISRVISNPNLTGALSDSAREEVLNIVPANATFPQIKRVAAILEQDMANRRTSIADQKADIERRMGGATGAGGGAGASATDVPSDVSAFLQGKPKGVVYHLNVGDFQVNPDGTVTRVVKK
jgi:hypothetical protein